MIASVPLIEGWENTYENPAKAKTASDRAIHFEGNTTMCVTTVVTSVTVSLGWGVSP